MSSVGVLIEKKNLSVLWEGREKKSKCPKKNFQSVKRGWRKKIISVEFRVFEKKELEGKF